MHGGPEILLDGTSLLHALKDRPRTTYAHFNLHASAGKVTGLIEDTGRLRTKSQEQILEDRNKTMYTRRPVIETLALVSYELQMFQRQHAPRPEGTYKSKSENQIWGVDLHKLRDIKKPRQRILGLKISKENIPSLKMADISDSEDGSDDDLTHKAARFAEQTKRSTPSMAATPFRGSHQTSAAHSRHASLPGSRPLSPTGQQTPSATHKHKKAPTWQKAVHRQRASVSVTEPSKREEATDEALKAVKEDPEGIHPDLFPATWTTDWTPDLAYAEAPTPLNWQALPQRYKTTSIAAAIVPSPTAQHSNRGFHQLFTRTKARAVAPRPSPQHNNEVQGQEGNKMGSSFVLGAPMSPEQQAALLEKKWREQQERLLQDRLELDRLRMQHQEILVAEQAERDAREHKQALDRAISLSPSGLRQQGSVSAKLFDEDGMTDLTRLHADTLSSEAGLGHLDVPPRTTSSNRLESIASAKTGQHGSEGEELEQHEGLEGPPQAKSQWPNNPEDVRFEDRTLPQCLSGSSLSRVERSMSKARRSSTNHSTRSSRFLGESRAYNLGQEHDDKGQAHGAYGHGRSRECSHTGEPLERSASVQPKEGEVPNISMAWPQGKPLGLVEGDEDEALTLDNDKQVLPMIQARKADPAGLQVSREPCASTHQDDFLPSPFSTPSAEQPQLSATSSMLRGGGSHTSSSAPEGSLPRHFDVSHGMGGAEGGEGLYGTAQDSKSRDGKPQQQQQGQNSESKGGQQQDQEDRSKGRSEQEDQNVVSKGRQQLRGQDGRSKGRQQEHQMNKGLEGRGDAQHADQRGKAKGAGTQRGKAAHNNPFQLSPDGRLKQEKGEGEASPLKQRKSKQAQKEEQQLALKKRLKDEPWIVPSAEQRGFGPLVFMSHEQREQPKPDLSSGRMLPSKPLAARASVPLSLHPSGGEAETKATQLSPKHSKVVHKPKQKLTPPIAAAPAGANSSDQGGQSSMQGNSSQSPSLSPEGSRGSAVDQPTTPAPLQPMHAAFDANLTLLHHAQARQHHAAGSFSAGEEELPAAARERQTGVEGLVGELGDDGHILERGVGLSTVKLASEHTDASSAADQGSASSKANISPARAAAAAAATAAAGEIMRAGYAGQAKSSQQRQGSPSLCLSPPPPTPAPRPSTSASTGSTSHKATLPRARASVSACSPTARVLATAAIEGNLEGPAMRHLDLDLAYPPDYNWTLAEQSALLQRQYAAAFRGDKSTTTPLKSRGGALSQGGGIPLVEHLAGLHRNLAGCGTTAPATSPSTSVNPSPSSNSPNTCPNQRTAAASPSPSDSHQLLSMPAHLRQHLHLFSRQPPSEPSASPPRMWSSTSSHSSPQLFKGPIISDQPSSCQPSVHESDANDLSQLPSSSHQPVHSANSISSWPPSPPASSPALPSGTKMPGKATGPSASYRHPHTASTSRVPCADIAPPDSPNVVAAAVTAHVSKVMGAPESSLTCIPSTLQPPDPSILPGTGPGACKAAGSSLCQPGSPPLGFQSLAPASPHHTAAQTSYTHSEPFAEPSEPQIKDNLPCSSNSPVHDAVNVACSTQAAPCQGGHELMSQANEAASFQQGYKPQQQAFSHTTASTPAPLWTPSLQTPHLPLATPPDNAHPALVNHPATIATTTTATAAGKSGLSLSSSSHGHRSMGSDASTLDDDLDHTAINDNPKHHTLRESSLILSLLQSVRNAQPPNSMFHITSSYDSRPSTVPLHATHSSTISESVTPHNHHPNFIAGAAPSSATAWATSSFPADPSLLPQHTSASTIRPSTTPSSWRSHANLPSRHKPLPISTDPAPLLPAATPSHQPLSTPHLTQQSLLAAHIHHHPASPCSLLHHPLQQTQQAPLPHHHPFLRQQQHGPRTPLARHPSAMYEHPRSRSSLYDATHLVPYLTELGGECPFEVRDLLMRKLGVWLDCSGTTQKQAPSISSSLISRSSAGDGDQDPEEADGSVGLCERCRGRQGLSSHGAWPADHSKCAGPLCRAAHCGPKWWAPSLEDWPFAQGGVLAGADKAGLRRQLMASFGQFGQ